MEVQYNNRCYQLDTGKRGRHLAGRIVEVLEDSEGVTIEYDGVACDYRLYEEIPAQSRVMDKKQMNAFLDRKEPLSIIQRRRKGMSVNF